MLVQPSVTVTTGTSSPEETMPSVADNNMTPAEDDKMSKHFRAAYLMVKGSVAEDLQNREELIEALQFAGI